MIEKMKIVTPYISSKSLSAFLFTLLLRISQNLENFKLIGKTLPNKSVNPENLKKYL